MKNYVKIYIAFDTSFCDNTNVAFLCAVFHISVMFLLLWSEQHCEFTESAHDAGIERQ